MPTYTEMVCGGREHLFSEEVKALMNVKIGDSEEALSDEEKMQFLMRRMEEKDADIQKKSTSASTSSISKIYSTSSIFSPGITKTLSGSLSI